MKISLAALALLLFAGVSRADSIWDYTGGVMTGCGCALTGSVTLDPSFAATSWTFSDGTHTLTSVDSSGAVLPLAPFNDPTLGPFFGSWFVRVTRPTDGWVLMSDYSSGAFEATDVSGVNAGTDPAGTYGYLQGHPGVWTESVPTAEPGTLALIGAGLAGLWARRRLQVRRSHVPRAVWDPLA